MRTVLPGEHVMKPSPQAIEIRGWRRRHPAMLFWRGMTRRPEGNGIPGLPGFEMTGNTEINQVDVFVRGQHNVGGLEITKDDGRLACVQVVQYGAELDADAKDLL